MSSYRLAERIFPIVKVEHSCMLSGEGDISIAFRMELPEIFTLSDNDYERLHQSWIRAIKTLDKQTVIHKQDVYRRRSYVDPHEQQSSFLNQAAALHFRGRKFLDHSCYLIITKKPSERRLATSALSGLMRKRLVPKTISDPLLIQQFVEKVGQFERILADCGLVSLMKLADDELTGTANKLGILEQYCFLLGKDDRPVLKDVQLKDTLRIGNDHGIIFSMADSENLPVSCGSRIKHEGFSTDRTTFPMGFASHLNLLLDCDHIYNQYIVIGDSTATMKELEARKLRLQSLSAYSRENAISRDATNDFLNESITHGRLPVKAHFNIIAWHDDPAHLTDLRHQIAAAIAQIGASPKLESDGAAQLWWAGIPGNSGDLPINETFDTFLDQASCFLNLDGNYRSDLPESGIRFCDRLSGKPIYFDLFDGPRAKGLSSNMGMLVCGTSGGGKSMTVNHIIRSLYDQGAHCVTVDIGGSYKGLCNLVGGYYFTYEESNPIRFNPFYLPPGQLLDTEKKESLKALLVTLWKQENESFNRSEYVAVSNALQGYYQYLEKDTSLAASFNSFYDYLKGPYVSLLREQKVKEKDFDIDNFLYVLRPYYKGGEFDYLLNATGDLDLLAQRFVVIELDNIKDHPILFPVVTLIVMEMFLSKMRKLKGVRKVLTIDEAWKAIANSGMAGFIQYAFKTMRKFNGIPNVVTQELDDLVSSPIVKDAIINNADIKILMDMRGYVNKFDKLQETLGLSEKGKTQVLSVNKDKREIFISVGSQLMKVVRNELSPEEYYAYTTEGRERVQVQSFAEKFGSIEMAISEMANQKRQGINNHKR